MSDLDIQIRRLDRIAEEMGKAAEQIEKNASFTLLDRIELVRSQICNEYCRWPLVYGDDEDRLQLKCDRCPLRWLS